MSRRYIDADKFEARINASPAFQNMGQDGFFLREIVLQIIDGQPTADVVEVRHGEWKYYDCVSSYDGCISGYACSVCNAFVEDEYFEAEEHHKFCGNCGAKMDGERREK